MADYIPQVDATFNLWQQSLIEIIEKNFEAWGISSEDVEALKASQTNWVSAFAKASNKQNRTSADVQGKNDAYQIFEKQFRGFVAQWISGNPKVSNTDRERMGLNIKNKSRTPVGIPESTPVASIDFSVRRQHTIHYMDDHSSRSKAKPEGVHGCEVWMKIGGEAPKDPSELTFLGTDTSTPFVKTFTGADVGKIVWYWLRWVNKRGQPGPWNTPVSAMVMG